MAANDNPGVSFYRGFAIDPLNFSLFLFFVMFFSTLFFPFFIYSCVHSHWCPCTCFSRHLGFSRVFLPYGFSICKSLHFFNFGKWSQPICYWVFVEFFLRLVLNYFILLLHQRKLREKNTLFPGGNLQLTTVPYFAIRVREVKFTYNNINKLIIKIVFYKSNFFG